MVKTLFVGDINVDIMMEGLETLPVVDREISCSGFEITVGSSAAIAAHAFASLGGSTAFAGLAGDDQYGRFMLRSMKEFGISTALVRVTDTEKTGVTVNLIYQGTRSQVTYFGTIAAYDGSNLSEQIFKEFKHIHFAGPYQQTKLRPKITALLKEAKSSGCSTSLDPQWDMSEKWEYLDQWLPHLDYLFVNNDEALSISGVSDVRTACGVLSEKTACVIIKAGKDGAFLKINKEITLVSGYRTELVDTTGAGDTFDAAFLYAVLEKKLDNKAAVAFANAAGARSCSFIGGVNARSTYNDIITYMEQNHE
jgi:sugar/nucleoside kinase (ribokinase family)